MKKRKGSFIMEFICEIFKETNELIEIREIGKISKQLFFDSETIKKYVPPKDKNIYFGVYARRTNSNGKAENCTSTRAIWCDIDGFDSDLTISGKVEDIKRRLEKTNIPLPSIFVSSGNGMHLYWLLNERTNEKVVNINRFIAGLLGGDLRATDKARILRLPDTMNVKNKDKHLNCKIVQADYNLIYDLNDFYKLIDKDNTKDSDNLKSEYITHEGKLIESIKSDRPCISNMLKGVSEGDRNFALGRIVKWLQMKGYTKKQVEEIIIDWNSLNNPPEDKSKIKYDFSYYWKRDYKLLGCSIEKKELQQILYKYCDRTECVIGASIGKIKLLNNVNYNNRLLKYIDNLTGNDLMVYGLLLRHKEGLTTSLLVEKLTNKSLKKPCISNKTRINSLKTLKKYGFIEVSKGARKSGLENLYKAKPQGTYGLGYTAMSNGAINGLIDKRITSGQFRLYTLLMKYAFSKGNCYPSLRTLAKELRVSSECISLMLTELERSEYIKKNHIYIKGNDQLFYTLLV